MPWTSLELRDADEVRLSATNGHGSYNVALRRHLATVQDQDILLGSVLIHSYALAESGAAQLLRADPPTFRGIEDGAPRLLGTTGSSWDSLRDGLAGVVEVAVVRNAYAHGTRSLVTRAQRRIPRAGGAPPEDQVPHCSTTRRCACFRGRLRALMQAGGIGQAP